MRRIVRLVRKRSAALVATVSLLMCVILALSEPILKFWPTLGTWRIGNVTLSWDYEYIQVYRLRPRPHLPGPMVPPVGLVDDYSVPPDPRFVEYDRAFTSWKKGLEPHVESKFAGVCIYRYPVIERVNGRDLSPGVVRGVLISSLPLVCLSGGVTLIILVQWLRKRLRPKAGLCLKCGYDLRASTERCPECGTQITAGKRDLGITEMCQGGRRP